MARSMGFSSKDEWDEYGCPGAYRLPRDADVVWQQEWQGWDDFLGVILPWAEAKELVSTLGLRDQAEYREVLRSHREGAEARADATAVDVGRLPAQPDVYYAMHGAAEWSGWDDFLGSGTGVV